MPDMPSEPSSMLRHGFPRIIQHCRTYRRKMLCFDSRFSKEQPIHSLLLQPEMPEPDLPCPHQQTNTQVPIHRHLKQPAWHLNPAHIYPKTLQSRRSTDPAVKVWPFLLDYSDHKVHALKSGYIEFCANPDCIIRFPRRQLRKILESRDR